MLPRLANVLGFSLEDLIGEEAKSAKRDPAPKLQRQMERIRELPKPKQRFVMETLETVLAQAKERSGWKGSLICTSRAAGRCLSRHVR